MTKGWNKDDEGKNDWFLKFMGGEGRELVRVGMEPVYEFVEKQEDSPWFIWFAPELPHYPLNAPDKYYNLYKDKELSESAKRYYANCTWFDDGVGQLMAYLKTKNMMDNTMFVYVNDNGWEQAPYQEFRSDSLRWHNGGDKGKLSMYDQSFRTPIIFSWKDQIEANVTKDALIHSADIPATILDYLNEDLPESYFGLSFKNVIEDEKDGNRTEIIGNINKVRSDQDMMGKDIQGYWMRTENWFFNWDANTNDVSLFDMRTDPNNDHNVAVDHPQLVNEYLSKLKEWKTSKGR